MPDFTDYGAESTTDSFEDLNLSNNDYQIAADAILPRQSSGAITGLLGSAALAIPDLIDTAASSKLVSWATGAKRGDINTAMLHAIDMPGVTNFYNQNQKSIEAISGIGGLVASELVARKITAPVSIFMTTLKSVPYVRRIATLDAEYAQAMNVVRNVDGALAKRGAMGIEQYAGEVSLLGTNSMKWNSAAGGFVPLEGTVKRSTALFGAKGLGAAVGARNALVTEGIAAAVLNQNEFLYTDSAAQNMAWMGLGVGLGAAGQWYSTAYQARKFVNSDQVRRSFAAALDPEGVEESRLLWHGKSVKPLSDAEGFLGGSYTDQITNLLVSATNLKEMPVGGSTDARSLLAQRESLATQHRKLARETAQKITTKGITTNGLTRFTMDAPGYGNHLDMVMLRDPASLYGVEMIGGVPDNLSSLVVHKQHMTRTLERIQEVEERLQLSTLKAEEKTQLTNLRLRLQAESNLTPSVLIDGEKMPITEAAAIEGFQEPRINFTPDKQPIGFQGDRKGIWAVHTDGAAPPISIDADLAIHMPSGKSLKDADHFDILRLYRAADQAVDHLSKFQNAITIPENPSWFQLDMAEEIMRRSDGAAKINWPKGMTRDSAQVESLVQKAEQMEYWVKKTQVEAKKAAAKGIDIESQLSKLRVRFNLPKLTAYERGVTGETEHPVEALLRGVNAYGKDKLKQMPLADIKQAVAEFKRLGDLAPTTAADVESLMGNSFKYMKDESGRVVKPVLMYSRPFNVGAWTPDAVAERLAANKMRAMGVLTGQEAGPLSRQLSTSILESPDFELAGRTHELMDNQIQGSTVGAAPQTFAGAVGKGLATSEWIARDNPILLAALRLRDSVERVARDTMRTAINGAFGDSLSVLENPRNASSKLLLDQFHSYRGGWDLLEKTVDRGNGFHAFTLGDTQKNHARWKELYGNDMKPGQTLLAPNGREVVLDDLSLDIQKRFNTVTDLIIKEKNTLLKANGMSQIDRSTWFTPPPNTNGKLIGFVIGPDGKAVPGMGVVASTPEEFARSKAKIVEKLNGMGMGYVFRTQDEIRDFASIWDRAQMDMINPGTTAVQPGKTSRGVLSGSDISLKSFSDSLTYVRDQFLSHANDITETLLKEQLNSAKARANIATEVTKNNVNPLKDTRYRSIYDMYRENLLGKSKLNSTGSVIGKLFNPVEGAIDAALAHATPTASTIWEATNGWFNRVSPWSKTAAARKDFDTLSAKLGPYMPFESAAELLEKQGSGARPWTAAGITGKLNQFSAGILLRFGEVAHPIMNMAGIINAMPAVIRNYTQQAGETAEAYAARIGHSATIFNLPNGKSMGVVDMSKLGARAFKRAWEQKSHADFEYMVKRGYLTQEVAEFHRQFGAIESKSSWEKFFTGDPNAKGFKSKGVVGWMSFLSDKSEDLSRSWGHMAGLELAESLGITKLEAKHAFAHDIANKMIANYSPNNRPEIFQGAIGANLGLFQSFIQNYYQRMFRYIETKDYGSLVTQYGTQASLFGVTSIPGWSEFNKAMSAAGEGENDPTSQIWNRFGEGPGDLIGGGIISNIPKLFGAPAVDLYSRGDTSVRLPGTVVPPAISISMKIMQGIGEGIQAFSDANPALTGTQLSEIVSNMMPNRPVAGIIEQFGAGGRDTDHYGQLVSETKGAMELTYRVLGLRSMRQSKEIEAFYGNKNAMEHKASADEVLRTATRSAMREGNYDALPDIFNKYLENGGDPRYFRRWIKSNFIAATDTRAQRQLDAMLKGNKMQEVIRLLDAGVSIDADEKTPNPEDSYGAVDQGDELNQPEQGLGTYGDQMTWTNPQGTDVY